MQRVPVPGSFLPLLDTARWASHYFCSTALECDTIEANCNLFCKMSDQIFASRDLSELRAGSHSHPVASDISDVERGAETGTPRQRCSRQPSPLDTKSAVERRSRYVPVDRAGRLIRSRVLWFCNASSPGR